MPPYLGVFGTFRADTIIVNLADEVHWLVATFGHILALYPQRYTKDPPFLIRQFVQDFHGVLVVLTSAVQNLEGLEPVDTFGQRMKFDDDNLVAFGKDVKVLVGGGDEGTTQLLWGSRDQRVHRLALQLLFEVARYPAHPIDTAIYADL